MVFEMMWKKRVNCDHSPVHHPWKWFSFFFNKKNSANSLGTPTLVPLLVDASEALEPPTSTSIKSKAIKQEWLVKRRAKRRWERFFGLIRMWGWTWSIISKEIFLQSSNADHLFWICVIVIYVSRAFEYVCFFFDHRRNHCDLTSQWHATKWILTYQIVWIMGLVVPLDEDLNKQCVFVSLWAFDAYFQVAFWPWLKHQGDEEENQRIEFTFEIGVI